jgi:FkbM family methyltransferase
MNLRTVDRYTRLRQTLTFGEIIRFLAHKCARSAMATMHPRGCMRRLTYRPSQSDWATIWETFGMMENDVALPFTPATIVDCGANGGFTGVYFRERWPRAKLVVIEPDPGNVEILRRNLGDEKDVLLFEAAVWSGDSQLAFDDSRLGNSGHILTSGSLMVRARTLDSIVQEAGLKSIDVLKMDIEGAEQAVFLEGPVDFLAITKAILIEFHGTDLERQITKLLRGHGFVLFQAGRKNCFLRV